MSFKSLLYSECKGRLRWVKVRSPLAYSAAVSSLPLSSHLVVSSPSTPTGPRAWIRPVEMPTWRE